MKQYSPIAGIVVLLIVQLAVPGAVELHLR